MLKKTQRLWMFDLRYQLDYRLYKILKYDSVCTHYLHLHYILQT